MLLNKKEGSITRANAINLTNNLASQAGRQASTSLPPGEGSIPSQTGRQAGALLPSGEGSNQTGSQAGIPQAAAHLPLGEGSSSSPNNCSPSQGSRQFNLSRQSGRYSPSL